MELINIKNLPMKKLEVNGKIFAYYEIDKKNNCLYLGIMEEIIPKNERYNENFFVVLIQKIEGMHFQKIGFLNVYSQIICESIEPLLTKTNGGYPVTEFRILEKPEERGNLEPHIYAGYISDPLNNNNIQYATWDKFGRCSNFSRKDCFLRHKTVN